MTDRTETVLINAGFESDGTGIAIEDVGPIVIKESDVPTVALLLESTE